MAARGTRHGERGEWSRLLSLALLRCGQAEPRPCKGLRNEPGGAAAAATAMGRVEPRLREESRWRQRRRGERGNRVAWRGGGLRARARGRGAVRELVCGAGGLAER